MPKHDNALKAIRTTDNFLHKGNDFVWDQPNDSWKIITTHTGHQIITNIQYDNTEHKPDLFLYTNLNKGDYNVSEIMKQNSEKLDMSRSWFIKQLRGIDRIGVKRFSCLPFDRFIKYWRQPLNPRKIDLTSYRYEKGMVRFHYDEDVYSVLLKWTELGEPTVPSVMSPFRNRSKLTYDDDKLLNWVKKSCGKGLYIFSDFDSMFEDEEDEFCYVTDILMFSE